MRFGVMLGTAALAIFLPIAAHAQECGPLQQVAAIQMLALSGGYQNMVPVNINGHPRLFLLDTGGFMTQISSSAVTELGLPTHLTPLHLYGASGSSTSSFAVAERFDVANMHLQNERLLVAPRDAGMMDGIFASDLMLHYDIDIDFGTGKLNYFLPEHCPGKVVYWQAADAPVAIIPVTIKDNSHIILPVKLDGHEFDALLDTGASRTSLLQGIAQQVFGLEPGGAGDKKGGAVNGDPELPSYSHVFKTLELEGIAISTPRVLIFPDRFGSQTTETGTHIKGFQMDTPSLMLGMDILRHLHIYFSAKEKLLYVTGSSSLPKPEARQATIEKALVLSPDNAALLNAHCFSLGLSNTRLADALVECDRALRAHSKNANILDSKALILYRMGRYQDALACYNQVLSIAPRQASSLFMRGQTKRKLGVNGADADIAAAKAMDADAAADYSSTDIPKD